VIYVLEAIGDINMTCEEYNRILVDYVLGDIDRARSAEVELHLAECKNCAREVQEISRTLDLLREADGRVSAVSPDPRFRNRVMHKIPHRKRDSVVLMHRRSSSKVPLAAALSAAAIFLAVIIYILAADSSNSKTMENSENMEQVPLAERSSGKPHPVDSMAHRPGHDSAKTQDTLPQPSKEADQEGGEPGEMVVVEPEVEPGPVPAQTPEAVAKEHEKPSMEDVPDENLPEFATEPGKDSAGKWVAFLYHTRGEVQVKRGGSDKWTRGSQDEKIYQGDTVKTSSRGGGAVSLSMGGSVVLNRSTVFSFLSHTESALEKGEILACSYRKPFTLNCNNVLVKVQNSGAYVQHRTKDTRIVAASGVVNIEYNGKTSVLPAGKGIVVTSGGKVKAIQKVNLEKEIEWVCDAGRKFKIWLEGESCRHSGYCAIQRNSSNLSNMASLHKMCSTGSLFWRLRLPHTMPCYIWVRYSKSEREPEKIGLIVNRNKIGEETINAAGKKWFWIRAFRTTLGRSNSMKLYFTSKKPVRSCVDLILITNDSSFKPPQVIPKGGYYGKK
jgi:hypothetical protein